MLIDIRDLGEQLSGVIFTVRCSAHVQDITTMLRHASWLVLTLGLGAAPQLQDVRHTADGEWTVSVQYPQPCGFVAAAFADGDRLVALQELIDEAFTPVAA